MIGAAGKGMVLLVPEAGLEPAQGCPYRILSPARLPFHHSGTLRNQQHGIFAGGVPTECLGCACENSLCPSFMLLSSSCST